MQAIAERRSRDGRIVAGLAAVLLAGLAFASLPVASASGTSYNNVQVLVTTGSNLNYTYFFTAYNVTGSLVATSQTPFPAAAFELPSGTYLFTVSAVSQTYYGCPLCMGPAATGTVTGTASNATTSTGSAPAGGTPVPIAYRLPAAEYGYMVRQVTGADTITISTQNITKLPTAQVTVKVSFVNGTAASGAWVSASVVGEWYYWWGSNSSVVMWAQTDHNGVANLVLPMAPTVVSAWDWVPVNLPASQTTTKVDVGGETVNVTAYWEPTYVGLAASALIIPPTSGVSLTLHYQTPNYWVVPLGATVQPGTSGGGKGASISNAPTGVPSGTQQAAAQQGSSSLYYLPSSIPSIQTGSGTQSSLGSTPVLATLLEGAAIGAAVAAVAAFAISTRSRKAST